MKKHTEWAKWVPIIQNCMNHTHHDTNEFVPYELHLGQKVERFWEKYIDIHKVDKTALEQKIFLAEKRIRNKAERRRNKINKNRNILKYKIGDFVLLKALNVSDSYAKLIAKFMSLYEGPYILSKKISSSTYTLINPVNYVERGNFHSSLFRPYYDNGQSKVYHESHPTQPKNAEPKEKQTQNSAPRKKRGRKKS